MNASTIREMFFAEAIPTNTPKLRGACLAAGDELNKFLPRDERLFERPEHWFSAEWREWTRDNVANIVIHVECFPGGDEAQRNRATAALSVYKKALM